MCKSLMMSQLFRLMKSDDVKSKKHLNFWMFDLLQEIWDGPQVPSQAIECDHFNQIAGIVVEIKLLGNIDVDSWEDLTNKSIYTGFAEMFTKTKVERESARLMDLVWERLTKLGANRQVQEVSYLLVHDKLPVLKRLFRIGLARDTYCDSCDAALE